MTAHLSPSLCLLSFTILSSLWSHQKAIHLHLGTLIEGMSTWLSHPHIWASELICMQGQSGQLCPEATSGSQDLCFRVEDE